MAVDRGEIDAQLREIGEGERWWERREFRDLPHILHQGERIRGLVEGRVVAGRPPRLRRSGGWLIVATDQRLLCLRQERFARRQVEIPAGEITKVRQSARFGGHQLTIQTDQRRLRLRIPKEDAFRFAGTLAPLFPGRPSATPIELEPLSWLPGIETVAALPGFGGIVSRIAMLSPPDPERVRDLQRMEETIEVMRGDIERLQQQVAFLEDLLQTRAEAAFLPGPGSDA